MEKQSNTFTILHAVTIVGKNLFVNLILHGYIYKSSTSSKFHDDTDCCIKEYSWNYLVNCITTNIQDDRIFLLNSLVLLLMLKLMLKMKFQ